MPINVVKCDNFASLVASLKDASEGDIFEAWNVFTKVKDSLPQGRRLENASWRLWWSKKHVEGEVAVGTPPQPSTTEPVQQSMEELSLKERPAKMSADPATSNTSEDEKPSMAFDPCSGMWVVDEAPAKPAHAAKPKASVATVSTPKDSEAKQTPNAATFDACSGLWVDPPAGQQRARRKRPAATHNTAACASPSPPASAAKSESLTSTGGPAFDETSGLWMPPVAGDLKRPVKATNKGTNFDIEFDASAGVWFPCNSSSESEVCNKKTKLFDHSSGFWYPLDSGVNLSHKFELEEVFDSVCGLWFGQQFHKSSQTKECLPETQSHTVMFDPSSGLWFPEGVWPLVKDRLPHRVQSGRDFVWPDHSL